MSTWDELHYNIDTGTGKLNLDFDSIIIVHKDMVTGDIHFGSTLLCSRCYMLTPDSEFRLTYKEYLRRTHNPLKKNTNLL